MKTDFYPLILGDGLLGSEMIRQTGWNYISRKKDGFDFLDFYSYKNMLGEHDVIINCIANTDTYSKDKNKFRETNFLAIIPLLEYCMLENKCLVHISSDYAYTNSVSFASEEDIPIPANNWYSYYKVLADEYIQNFSLGNFLIIRTSFKPRPFPYRYGITTQKGNFEYVDQIAEKIIKLINLGARGVFNVGHSTPRTIYQLALETNPNVLPWNETLDLSMPTDITMNVEKYNEFIRSHSSV